MIDVTFKTKGYPKGGGSSAAVYGRTMNPAPVYGRTMNPAPECLGARITFGYRYSGEGNSPRDEVQVVGLEWRGIMLEGGPELRKKTREVLDQHAQKSDGCCFFRPKDRVGALAILRFTRKTIMRELARRPKVFTRWLRERERRHARREGRRGREAKDPDRARGRAGVVRVVHWLDPRDHGYVAPRCNSMSENMTNDPAEVTCKQCKALMPGGCPTRFNKVIVGAVPLEGGQGYAIVMRGQVVYRADDENMVLLALARIVSRMSGTGRSPT